MNATATAGALTYAPSAGTILDAGNHTLSCATSRWNGTRTVALPLLGGNLLVHQK